MKTYFITAACLLSIPVFSQNDIDAIRYSQTYFGGTSRSKAMAGSFGALGADGACMAINPAGIGLYKKGDINISFGLRFFSVDASHNGTSNKTLKSSVPFDGLTLVGAWDGKISSDNHHALGLSCNQILNFNTSTVIEGSSNHKSITDDMLASSQGVSPANLENNFSGMAYETYLIDTLNGKYYSFINPKFNTIQSKEIQTTGRVNEWCFNYAYGYKDKLYFGVTLGVPTVNYSYSSVYSETDSKDSMWIRQSGGTIKDSYDYPINYYQSTKTGNLVGGFKEMKYQETFRTTGTGYNLKLGVIYRASDVLRLGVAYHTPTVYNLTDTYIYNMSSTFDNGDSYASESPDSPGGIFKYRLITPMKFTGSVALLYKKLGALNIDYDLVNYSQASLQSSPQEFAGVNSVIRSKYSQTSNLKVGAEANFSPFFVRLGYAMYGSPFGQTFSGDLVRNFFTGGLGFRQNKFYIDLSFTKSISSESYYMYNANYVDKTTLKNSGTTIGISIGSKF